MSADKALAEAVASNILRYYGVRVEVTADRSLIIGATDHADLTDIVMFDHQLDAIGRGYYLANVPFRIMPDWTLNPAAINQARLAAYLTRDIKRLLRWLTRLLTTKGPHR